MIWYNTIGYMMWYDIWYDWYDVIYDIMWYDMI